VTGLNPDVWRKKIFRSGWSDAGGPPITVREPATGDTLGEVGRATPEDVARATRKARAAQPDWAAHPLVGRAGIFRQAARWLEDNADEVKEWIVRETGSIPDKAGVELNGTIAELHQAAGMVVQPRGLVLPSEPQVTSLARRVPHGVVGVISPFNFPMILAARAVAPALAVGNTVVLKPDQRTPISGGMILARAFEEAGIPSDVLHVLPGGADAGEALVTDPEVAMIAFTGSTHVGRRIGELAGKHLKKVSLELGGKNALIILDDADLELAVSNAAWGAFLHQGQICMATGRVLVPESLAKAFIAKLAEKADHLPVGDPFREQVALGPLIDEQALRQVEEVVNASVAAGARLRAGGTSDRLFFRPTVLDEVAPGMRAFEDEIFGPVAPVTVYRDEDDAAALANLTDYGLSAGIITGSAARGLEFSARLKTGIVHVNDQTIADEPWAPFGGTGASGNGSRHGGPANWEEFTSWQWLTIKHSAPRYPF
jgi:benzaldehyde dehydrogenase (NAD)